MRECSPLLHSRGSCKRRHVCESVVPCYTLVGAVRGDIYAGVSSLVTLPWELWEVTCMRECRPLLHSRGSCKRRHVCGSVVPCYTPVGAMGCNMCGSVVPCYTPVGAVGGDMYAGVSSLVTLPWELWELTCIRECRSLLHSRGSCGR